MPHAYLIGAPGGQPESDLALGAATRPGAAAAERSARAGRREPAESPARRAGIPAIKARSSRLLWSAQKYIISAAGKRLYRHQKGASATSEERAYSQLIGAVMNTGNGRVNSGPCAIAAAECGADSIAIGAIPVSVSRPSSGGGGSAF
jgi:hypothetical protein